MKRRIISAFLAVCLIAALGLQVSAASYDGTVNTKNIVAGGRKMFIAFEGNYDNVVASDSGACGMGIMGWRGPKALELMKLICSKAPSYSKQILGNTFYNEIVSASSSLVEWNYRTLNSDEASRCKTLISSSYGVEAQNELSEKDILTYIDYAWKAGIRSDAAILYYCSVENHYGHAGAIRFMQSVRAAMGISEGTTIKSLKSFHNGVVQAAQIYSNVNSTLAYRTKVYNYIKDTLHWDINGGASTSVDTPTTTVLGFTDISASSWYYPGVEYVVNNGLFNGMSKTEFCPNRSMTRGMVVTVLYRLNGKQIGVGGSGGISYSNTFVDISYSDYFYTPVLWASANGIVNGMTTYSFMPDREVTREQLAVMLYRYASYLGRAGSVDNSARSLQKFSDGSYTSSYAKVAMAWAVDQGLISGVKVNNTTILDPQGQATRAQVATIIMRFAKKL